MTSAAHSSSPLHASAVAASSSGTASTAAPGGLVDAAVAASSGRSAERADFERIETGGVFAVLEQFAVVEVAGADAAAFLHTQLSNDIESLDSAAARLAGYCSPKGRLLASVLVWRTEPAIRLLVSADLAPGFVKRLSMFVLRAKAKLTDVSASQVAIGFAGEATAALSGLFPVLPDTVHGVVTNEAGSLIRVPDAPPSRQRFLWITSRERFDAGRAALATTLGEVPASVWDWLGIQAGEPRITAATYEQFVPQMINFEVLGGVNFKKGCYPGQEVVARSQYRGTIKRRAMRAHAEAAKAGDEVFDPADPDQPCGRVVNAAPAPGGGVDCLVEIKLAALDSASIHVGSADGAALTFVPLPYLLPVEN
ncbi:MAG: folate-binding protein YgfZ [Pararobbsia sp.]